LIKSKECTINFDLKFNGAYSFDVAAQEIPEIKITLKKHVSFSAVLENVLQFYQSRKFVFLSRIPD